MVYVILLWRTCFYRHLWRIGVDFCCIFRGVCRFFIRLRVSCCGAEMTRHRNRAANQMLSTSIRTQMSHNRRLEERHMWQANERLKRRASRSRSPPRSGRHRRLRMDEENQRCGHRNAASNGRADANSRSRANASNDLFWTKQLLDHEEKDPARWGHSGYRELYLNDKRRDDGVSVHQQQQRWRRPRSVNRRISPSVNRRVSPSVNRRVSPSVNRRVSPSGRCSNQPAAVIVRERASAVARSRRSASSSSSHPSSCSTCSSRSRSRGGGGAVRGAVGCGRTRTVSLSSSSSFSSSTMGPRRRRRSSSLSSSTTVTSRSVGSGRHKYVNIRPSKTTTAVTARLRPKSPNTSASGDRGRLDDRASKQRPSGTRHQSGSSKTTSACQRRREQSLAQSAGVQLKQNDRPDGRESESSQDVGRRKIPLQNDVQRRQRRRSPAANSLRHSPSPQSDNKRVRRQSPSRRTAADAKDTSNGSGSPGKSRSGHCGDSIGGKTSDATKVAADSSTLHASTVSSSSAGGGSKDVSMGGISEASSVCDEDKSAAAVVQAVAAASLATSSGQDGAPRCSLSQRFGKLAQLSRRGAAGDGRLAKLRVVRDLAAPTAERKRSMRRHVRASSEEDAGKRVIIEEEQEQRAGSGERISFENEFREYFGCQSPPPPQPQQLPHMSGRSGRRRRLRISPPKAGRLPSDWETDVSVRYRYYRDAGYFRDHQLNVEEYAHWERWWYHYRRWNAGGTSHRHRTCVEPPARMRHASPPLSLMHPQARLPPFSSLTLPAAACGGARISPRRAAVVAAPAPPPTAITSTHDRQQQQRPLLPLPLDAMSLRFAAAAAAAAVRSAGVMPSPQGLVTLPGGTVWCPPQTAARRRR